VINTFAEEFPDAVIGFSSHDSGIAMALVAYVLGARVVEKHLTLNRAMRGTDHAFSLEPVGIRKVVRDLRRARVALGNGVKMPYPSEAAPLTKMAKKLVASRDLPAGRVLTAEDVASKSPGDGLPPHEWDNVIGRRTRVALQADDNIRLEDLEASS
jgi:N-acetylneuraminate synthase/sialic acid synthase